jgi:hypothetical protein
MLMLPLHLQNALTTSIATGESGSYGPAMVEAMEIWTKKPEESA